MANTINVTAYYGAMRGIMEDIESFENLKSAHGKPPVQSNQKDDVPDDGVMLPIRMATGIAMGDMLDTGIPGGVDCDLTTPL